MFPPYIVIDHLEERVTHDPQVMAAFPWYDIDVPVDTHVLLYFSGKSAPSVCKIWVNDTLAYEYGVGFHADYSGPSSSVTPTTSTGYGAANGLLILVDKIVDFASSQPVTVTYLYEEATGRNIEGSFRFTCADSVPPTLLSIVLGKGSAKELVLTFNEEIAAASLAIDSTDGFVPSINSTTINGTVVYLKFDDELSFNATYSISGTVDDASGNQAAVSDSVTTEDYHIDCSSKMPQYWLDELDENGYLLKLCNLFSEVLSLAYKDVDYWRLIYDYDEAYTAHIEEAITSYGAEGLLTQFVSERKVLSVLFDIYRRKGIKIDMAGVINTFVGVKPKIEEWYDDRFRIGYSKLNGSHRIIGDRSIDPFHFRVIFGGNWYDDKFRIGYSKLDGPDRLIGDIEVDPLEFQGEGGLTDAQRQAVTRIVQAIKPANTTFTIVEPSTTPIYWRIGYSKLDGPHRLC